MLFRSSWPPRRWLGLSGDHSSGHGRPHEQRRGTLLLSPQPRRRFPRGGGLPSAGAEPRPQAWRVRTHAPTGRRARALWIRARGGPSRALRPFSRGGGAGVSTWPPPDCCFPGSPGGVPRPAAHRLGTVAKAHWGSPTPGSLRQKWIPCVLGGLCQGGSGVGKFSCSGRPDTLPLSAGLWTLVSGLRYAARPREHLARPVGSGRFHRCPNGWDGRGRGQGSCSVVGMGLCH